MKRAGVQTVCSDTSYWADTALINRVSSHLRGRRAQEQIAQAGR